MVTRSDIQPIKLADGFQFMEGAAFDRDGFLYVVDGRQGLVARINRDSGAWTAYCTTTGRPNGSAFHRDSRLFCADPGLAAIVEIPAGGGSYRVFADRCSEDDQPFRGPNDLRFDQHGNLYWTDPRGSSIEEPIGSIYWAGPDGQARRFATGLAFPNGLAFTADWSTLYVAESRTRRIHAWRLQPDGSAGEHRIFAELAPSGDGSEPGQPDGISFGADGNLYVAMYGAGRVLVLDAAGHVNTVLPVPGPQATNLAFWGTSLYVTEGSMAGVWRLDIGVRGQPLYAGWQG